jgi:hypothetical protein
MQKGIKGKMEEKNNYIFNWKQEQIIRNENGSRSEFYF